VMAVCRGCLTWPFACLRFVNHEHGFLSTTALRLRWVCDCGILRGEYAIAENERFIRCQTRCRNCTLHDIVLFTTRLNHPSIPTTNGVRVVPSEVNDSGRTRTCAPRLRGPTPYPHGPQGLLLAIDVSLRLWGEQLGKVRRHRACRRTALDGRSLGPRGIQWRRRGYRATVARLTPDQKVGHSNLSARVVCWSSPASSSADCQVCSGVVQVAEHPTVDSSSDRMVPGSIPDGRIWRGVATASALDAADPAKTGPRQRVSPICPLSQGRVLCRTRFRPLIKRCETAMLAARRFAVCPRKRCHREAVACMPNPRPYRGSVFLLVARVTGFQFPASKFHRALRGQSSRARAMPTTFCRRLCCQRFPFFANSPPSSVGRARGP
jgi:hypothetical protein